ncbi:MAG: Kelch repeat-containing protein, partial [Polyangiaceae bacterium]
MKTRAYSLTMTFALAATLAGAWGCGGDGVASVAEPPHAVEDSPAAQMRIEQLRARFLLPARIPQYGGPSAWAETTPARRSVLGADVASGFEVQDGYVRALIPAEARQAAARTASVALPEHAGDPVRLEDDSSHVAVTFALRGASDSELSTSGGVALYPSALAGADVLHRVNAEGTEDYVVFEQRPEKEEIAYDVDVSRVAGLRLVSNTVEFLDEGGTPRLRIAPPYVVDTNGVRAEGALAVDGCVFDTSPRAPWGRAVTSPGATRCAVRVSWKASTYPAIVDPSWTNTASMTTSRDAHTATVLGSGQVLLAGGYDGTGATSTAELYDSGTGTFATTGSMVTARWFHTATLLGAGATAGQVLVASGTTANNSGFTVTQSAELYDPAAGAFTPTGSMMTARATHTATLLGSGEVLIVG